MTPCKNSDFYNAWSHKDQTEVRKINQFYNPFLMSYVCTYLNVPYDATQKTRDFVIICLRIMSAGIYRGRVLFFQKAFNCGYY